MGILEDYLAAREKLKIDVEEVLLTHVAPAVMDEMQEQVQEKVYDAYIPRVYVRRMEDGGLKDRRNYEASVEVGSMTLTVENLTKDAGYWRPPGMRDRFLTPVVESGAGYDYKSPGPRPFNESTEQEVVQNGTVDRELKIGLTERGHNIKEG